MNANQLKRPTAEDPRELDRFPTVIHALRHWANRSAAKTAYTFLASQSREQTITFQKLDESVRRLAAQFHREGLQGERIVIAMGSGIDYMIGFLGCLAAGVVAVPLYPPNSEGDWNKLRSVVRDCSPKALLLNGAVKVSHGEQLSTISLEGSALWTVEELLTNDAPELSAAPVNVQGLAFLQYTSGSTGDPKGVMVSHACLMHNERTLAAALHNEANSVLVSWLPFFHDMGMIGVNLQALTVGAHAVLMSPRSFVRDPINWLRAISKYRGTTAGGPNFAYDLCTDKVSDDELPSLDLSSWQVAFDGAEPVKAGTLERFYQRFRKTGFRKETAFPCYGLAEATLYVAGGPFQTPPSLLEVERDPLNEQLRAIPIAAKEKMKDLDRALTCVGLGLETGLHQQLVRAVDPSTWASLPDGMVGEIWLKSLSIARGYWNKPKATAETFQAYTTDTGEGPFLRTGDLGFILEGRLFITGRVKDLIIVNGVNYYPQDLEATVQSLSSDFHRDYGAAFAFDNGRLAIVQALQREAVGRKNFDELIADIRRSVLRVHGIVPSYVGLVKRGEIPRTSSGKIQRGEVRRRLLAKTLEVLCQWEGTPPSVHPALDLPSDEKIEIDRRPELKPSTIVDKKIAWIQQYCQERFNSFLADERRTIPPYVVLDFGNQGLFGMQVPSQYGGLGLSNRDFLRVMETLGGQDLTLALFVGLNNVLGVRPVLLWGTEQLKAQYLPVLAQGRELAAFALTEPAAGSNPQAIEATAHPTANGTYRIRGTKSWSGSAAWSGMINVFAKAVDAQGRVTGVSAFAIPQTSAGVRQGPEALTMGLRGMIQNTIYFEDVEAQPWQVLGELGHGMTVAQDALCYGRVAIAATCLGAMKRCFQFMLRYADQREVSTGRLLQHPHARSVLTEAMHVINGVEALTESVAERLDLGQEVSAEVLALCKSVSTEALWKMVDNAMQMAGGRGYIETNFIPQLFRDARVFRIFEGPTETLNHFVGSSALRGKMAIRDFVSAHISEAEVAKYYDAVLQRCRGKTEEDAKAAALDHWQSWSVGDYLNQLILYAGAFSQEKAKTSRAWLEEQLERAVERLERTISQFGAIGEPDALREFGRLIEQRIGGREQRSALPNTSMDALLLQTHGPSTNGNGVAPPVVEKVGSPAPNANIIPFISQWVAKRCHRPLSSIDAELEFAALGLGSIDAVDLSAELSEQFKVEIDSTVLWSYPNIKELAGFVTGEIASARNVNNGRPDRTSHGLSL